MVASSQTVQRFSKDVQGMLSANRDQDWKAEAHSAPWRASQWHLPGHRISSLAQTFQPFSFWRLKIVQDHSIIYAFGWIQILRRWNIVSKVSNNSGGVRWFMIWKLRSISFVFVHVRIIWNLWMSLESLSIFDQLRGQMATLKIAYGPSVMLRQGGHGCQQPTVTQSALPRCGWWWRLRP